MTLPMAQNHFEHHHMSFQRHDEVTFYGVNSNGKTVTFSSSLKQFGAFIFEYVDANEKNRRKFDCSDWK